MINLPSYQFFGVAVLPVGFCSGGSPVLGCAVTAKAVVSSLFCSDASFNDVPDRYRNKKRWTPPLSFVASDLYSSNRRR